MSTRIRLRLPENQQSITLDCREGESLLEALLRHKLPYRAECGGRGTCGKCRIRVLEGELRISSWDRAFFREEELKLGYRLSCKAYPEEDCLIELFAGFEDRGYEIITAMSGKGHEAEAPSSPAKEEQITATAGKHGQDLSIGIDLGTTTLAFALVDRTGRVIRTHASLNPQRVYGADVISRIKASTEGRKEHLRELIRTELKQGIRELLKPDGTEPEQIRQRKPEGKEPEQIRQRKPEGKEPELIGQIMLAGNTTMIHLLMGYDCRGLGIYPFTPVNVNMVRQDTGELLSEAYSIPITILPGVSAFVGGDILAGLLACGFDKAEELCLFVDLGTNGEMALGNRNKILVSSTAAGPAFEGGNLSCGVGSIPGAISHVMLAEGACSYETIGGKPAIGICGTGVIELVSELLRTGRMDESGLLAEPYFEQGFELAGMSFLQKDIRELQMAKAAIRAGIEILARRYGISYADIHKVYLAGGFGYKLDVAKAVHIGLFPPELAGRIEAVGNSALAGSIRCLTKEEDLAELERLRSVSQEIHLSNEGDFYESYIGAMSF